MSPADCQLATTPSCLGPSGLAAAQLGLRAARQGPRRRTFSLPLANGVTKRSLTELLRGRDGTTNTSLARHAAGHGGRAGQERAAVLPLDILVPVSCLSHTLNPMRSHVRAVFVPTPEQAPMPDLPRFQKHPRLCAAKLTAGFRECGEAGGVVPSNMEAEWSFRSYVIPKPLRSRRQHFSLGFSPLAHVLTHPSPPPASMSFFPISPPIVSPQKLGRNLNS